MDDIANNFSSMYPQQELPPLVLMFQMSCHL